MTLTTLQHQFAGRAAEVARALGIVKTPTLDEAKFRLVEGDVAIDLFNPWHLTGCRPDPDPARLTELLDLAIARLLHERAIPTFIA